MIDDLLFYTTAILFIALSLFWTVRILIAYAWMKKSQKVGKIDHQKQIYIIIPVLDEISRIGKTTRHFLKLIAGYPNAKICIVSTEKEYEINPKGINTIDIASKLAEENQEVLHFHYKRTDGKMAHQLNYAIREILKGGAENALFAVYNADSRPHQATLDWVCQEKNKKHKVFQQYGNYFKNIDTARTGDVLISAASWQTRWSIGFEIYHALLQFLFPKEEETVARTLFYPMNYCIGHGLFFTKDVFSELGGFSENMHNEDAIFGLELSHLREKIIPIPYLEDADSPDSAKGLLIQKSTWFFGPFDSFRYMGYIRRKRRMNAPADKFRLAMLSLGLFSHAVYWVTGPTMMLYMILSAMISVSPARILVALISAALFLAWPNYLSWMLAGERKDIKVLLSNIKGSLQMYILHGLSAYRTIAKITMSSLAGREIKKEKTPMRK